MQDISVLCLFGSWTFGHWSFWPWVILAPGNFSPRSFWPWDIFFHVISALGHLSRDISVPVQSICETFRSWDISHVISAWAISTPGSFGPLSFRPRDIFSLVISALGHLSRDILARGHFCPRSFQPRVISFTGHFGHGTYHISVWSGPFQPLCHLNSRPFAPMSF